MHKPYLELFNAQIFEIGQKVAEYTHWESWFSFHGIDINLSTPPLKILNKKKDHHLTNWNKFCNGLVFGAGKLPLSMAPLHFGSYDESFITGENCHLICEPIDGENVNLFYHPDRTRVVLYNDRGVIPMESEKYRFLHKELVQDRHLCVSHFHDCCVTINFVNGRYRLMSAVSRTDFSEFSERELDREADTHRLSRPMRYNGTLSKDCIESTFDDYVDYGDILVRNFDTGERCYPYTMENFEILNFPDRLSLDDLISVCNLYLLREHISTYYALPEYRPIIRKFCKAFSEMAKSIYSEILTWRAKNLDHGNLWQRVSTHSYGDITKKIIFLYASQPPNNRIMLKNVKDQIKKFTSQSIIKEIEPFFNQSQEESGEGRFD